jgi:Dolichyl-phosphate-mannose-protein mannosyltransferase
LLLLGVVLRLRQYLSGRSLWADEAMLALNIVNRDFAALFQPLEYDQGAPLGFLLVEKFFNVILGRHELVFRFFPLLAGLASLWLFYLLAKRTLRGAGFYLALALFAVNPALIYYSSEAKQYVLDVTVTLGLLLLATPVFQGRSNQKNYIYLGLAGLVGLWFSHPALFIVAGIGIALAIQYLRTQDHKNLRTILGIGLLWLANLALLYFINLRNLSQNDYLTDYWSAGFLPLPPWSDLGWINELITYQFNVQLVPVLVLILILAGWFVMFREQGSVALSFALITVFAFTASALRLYPVNGRLSLFLIPLGIILLGKAVEFIQASFSSNKLAATVAVTVVSGYLLITPLVTSVQNFITPKYYEHIRPTMQILSDSWKDGDALFVTAWAEPAFRFYAPFYGLEGIEIVSTEIEDYPDGEKLKLRIKPLVGKKRVWVLFSHVYEQGGFNERDFLVAYLDEIGEKRREILKSGTSVYLFFYDLTK